MITPFDHLYPVSIHAPARGATVRLRRACSPFSVSIHAPARGATTDDITPLLAESGFNSRAREGRDRRSHAHKLTLWVSIHAPARGATVRRTALRLGGTGFNSRAREGRDMDRIVRS